MEIGTKGGTVMVISPLKGNSRLSGRHKSGRQNFKNRRQNHLDGTAEEGARLIRGEKGTPVKLLFLPKGEETTKEIILIRTQS